MLKYKKELSRSAVVNMQRNAHWTLNSPSSILQRDQKDGWSPSLEGLEEWDEPGLWWNCGGHSPLRPSIPHLYKRRKESPPCKAVMRHIYELLWAAQMSLPCHSAVPGKKASGGFWGPL